MSGVFKLPSYKQRDLIKAVKVRPCLWDKSDPSYKIKADRRDAWQEIFVKIIRGYEQKSSEEKRVIADQTISRWTNIRDAFQKSLNKRYKKRQKYIFHDDMKFLKSQLINKSQVEENLSDSGEQEFNNVEFVDDDVTNKYFEIENNSNDDADESIEADSSKRNGSLGLKNNIKQEDPFDTPNYEDERVMNEDEAFFASLLPTIATYSIDERLEFRIDVLTLMRKINDKRNS